MSALSNATGALHRTLGAAFEAAIILAIIVALAFAAAMVNGRAPSAATALARGGADIWIADESLRTADGSLQFGDYVAFGYVSRTAESIQLQCFQPVGSTDRVFAASRMLSSDGSGTSDQFTLGPSIAWDGGAASCTAMLGHRAKNGKYSVEAKVEFEVAP